MATLVVGKHVLWLHWILNIMTLLYFFLQHIFQLFKIIVNMYILAISSNAAVLIHWSSGFPILIARSNNTFVASADQFALPVCGGKLRLFWVSCSQVFVFYHFYWVLYMPRHTYWQTETLLVPASYTIPDILSGWLMSEDNRQLYV